MPRSLSSFFLPKDTQFTPLFKEASMNIRKAGIFLEEMITTDSAEVRTQKIKDIYDLEHANDDITHGIKVALCKTFITPFDREDIYHLSSLVDDVIDLINMVAKKIRIYGIDPHQDKFMIKMSKIIQKSCDQMEVVLKDISAIKKDIFTLSIKVHHMESEADDIYENAIKEIFDTEPDVKEIIKRKEIYKGLEEITDKCSESMYVMEAIHIKYS